MRREQLLHLADSVRQHQERLETVVSELAERGEPISDLDARLIIEVACGRLSVVEGALRADALYGRHGLGRIPGLRKVAWRLRLWRSPRIGILRQYPPKPLRVPTKYFRERPPVTPPRISIVTPSYQQGRFLGRTIHSIVTQNYPALEYVVQDGASSDGSVDVLRAFEQKLTAWRSDRDDGQGDAINRGFEQTSGEIMAWLNSDDLLLPGTLAYVARYFVEHPDVDVVYGNRLTIDAFDGQIGAWILPEHDDFALTLADYVPQETLFWRRRIWEAAGGRVDTSFRYALDWDLLLRFRAAEAKIVRLPRFVGAFRVHADQKTTVDEDAGLAECDLLRRRLHGRSLATEEVIQALQPYFAKHVRAHNWQRFVDCLPIPRAVVPTAPSEPAARVPALGDQASEGEAAVVSPLVPRADVAAGAFLPHD